MVGSRPLNVTFVAVLYAPGDNGAGRLHVPSPSSLTMLVVEAGCCVAHRACPNPGPRVHALGQGVEWGGPSAIVELLAGRVIRGMDKATATPAIATAPSGCDHQPMIGLTELLSIYGFHPDQSV